MVHTIYIDPIVKVDFKHCKWHGMCGFIAIIRSCCDEGKKLFPSILSLSPTAFFCYCCPTVFDFMAFPKLVVFSVSTNVLQMD